MTQYFGTDGIRGSYGSELINEAFADKFGQAIGTYLTQNNSGQIVVAIASDNRPSSPSLKKSLADGLNRKAIKVIDFGVTPTPALAYGVIKHKADFGLMVTASHNPASDNGLKCFNEFGTKLRVEEENIIEELIGKSPSDSVFSENIVPISVLDDYLGNIESHFAKLNLSGLSIALDCANGATCQTTHRVLQTFGAKVLKIHHGDGVINSDCGSEHLASLQKLIREKKADLGIAHDGDGDRVRFIDNHGDVIDGDQVLGLIALKADKDKVLENGNFVSTIHSNSGLMSFFESHQINGLTSNVGDRNVFLKMVESKSNWGGESSGHIICRDYLPTGDGLFAALYVLNAIISEKKSLTNLAQQVQLWPSISGSFHASQKPPIQSMPEMFQSLQSCEEYLGQEGRILLRYSGTEPKLRLLVEGKSAEKINLVFERLKNAIEKSL